MRSSSGMAALGTEEVGAGRAAEAAEPVPGEGTRRGRLLDELAGLVLPVVMPVVRRLPAVILVIIGMGTAVGVLALVGAARDDAAIAAHSAVGTAEVLPGSSFSRTLIRFTTADGELVLPEKGVFYPRGLRAGQIVRVEYDRTQPERVRVLGRGAWVGYLPVGLMVLGLWVMLLPVAFWLRGRQLLRLEAAADAAAAETAADAAAEAAVVEAVADPGGTAVRGPTT